jgi:hypothetical protein
MTHYYLMFLRNLRYHYFLHFHSYLRYRYYPRYLHYLNCLTYLRTPNSHYFLHFPLYHSCLRCPQESMQNLPWLHSSRFRNIPMNL